MGITDRIDGVTGIGKTRLKAVLPAPRSVKIELNSNCNYRCRFCVRTVRENDDREMDRGLYSRVVREMRAAGVEELGVFYINEPFTCGWLAEAVEEAKGVGFPYVFLTTNGSAASEWKLRAVMAAGLDSLKFSVNFSDDEQFRAVADVSARLYRRALENLKVARRVRDEGGFKCGIYASSIAFDGEQGERMRELVARYVEPWVDEHYWLPLYGMDGASKASGMKPQAGNPGRLGNLRESLPCWAVFTEGHVTVDGGLAACCFGSGLDGGLKMGDLTKVGFMEAWNSEAFQALRRAHLARDVTGTACEGCMG